MQIAKIYVILKITFYYKINGYYSQASYEILEKRLIFRKKEFIKNWVLEIQP